MTSFSNTQGETINYFLSKQVFFHKLLKVNRDYLETSSPTADINHILIEVTLAAARGDRIVTLDIGTVT